MLIRSVKNQDYGLLVNKVKINMEQGYLISRLKNPDCNNFYFDENDKLWYYKNYKKNIRIIDIFYPDKRILNVEFKNNDVNDYLPENLIIKLDPKHENNFIEPLNCEIIDEGTPVLIKEGMCAGEYRNMYWKIKDNENNKYYIMHIKDNLYTKISKRDIKKVLTFSASTNKTNFRPTWRLFQNGYVCCTINNGVKQKVYYLHQLIMDVHDEDLTNLEKTVDHINQDKLDNRRKNLRLVNMSVQNSNRGKPERRVDACELPDGVEQTDLPKYVVYRKEILNKETNRYREYFYICNHPKLEKRWETTKSMNVSLAEKLKLAKLKLQEIEGVITEKQYQKESGEDKKIDLPPYIRLGNCRDKLHFIFEKHEDDIRLNYKMVLKSTDLQNELNNFIDEVNTKYPELSINRYIIKNISKIKSNDVSTNEKKSSMDFKLTLPPNFSFFKETKGGYQFAYSKSINGERLCAKSKLQSNNIQNEFDNFINIVNTKFPQLKLNKYQIPNIPDNFKIFETSTTENKHSSIEEVLKPDMPTNFSITNVNNIDYIQFCKKIDDTRHQYKMKINSYDIRAELNRFIDELNEKYDFGLNKSEYQITNTNDWKTMNKIIEHTDTPDRISQRERTNKYLEKKKQELGEDEFKRQKADYAKQYRQQQKEIEI